MPEDGSRHIVRSLAWDLALNATIPVACYVLAKRYISSSEMTALLFATAFPTLKSIYDLLRHHEADPVTVLVLLGIVTSIVALWFGGGARVLLIRESFFTGAFGIACLVSLLFPRPIMFYFGRHFMAGRDPEQRRIFESRWQYPSARRAHRLVTAVWGVVYVGEFCLRVALAFALPTAIALVLAPTLLGVATIATIIWTFRYARNVRAGIPA